MIEPYVVGKRFNLPDIHMRLAIGYGSPERPGAIRLKKECWQPAFMTFEDRTGDVICRGATVLEAKTYKRFCDAVEQASILLVKKPWCNYCHGYKGDGLQVWQFTHGHVATGGTVTHLVCNACKKELERHYRPDCFKQIEQAS